MRKLSIAVATVLLLLAGGVLAACTSQADVASDNLSKAADNFEIYRQIVFVNGITDKYLEEIDGYCSLGNSDKPREISVTCKVGQAPNGDGIYVKDFVGLADNVTYVAHQVQGVPANTAHYRIVFAPSQVIPDVRTGT